ncbi:hypothetical protein [Salinicoccus albus]|uniref:hypothetical protein n=1 Tax=Salinicoccus albus TaxID=418756 RepID=UPI0003752AD1|nr:hypothetical protein [Salinicoccus albus]
MSLIDIDENELYPTEKLGPAVEGTILYKVGEQTHFKGAYITTNERMIMNVDMNGEPYKRVFSYQDIVQAIIDKDAMFIEFPEGMGKVAMIEITDGDAQEFVDYVNQKVQ